MIQTDLEKIRYYGSKNEKRNWDFRSFLKNYDMSIDEMDEIVNRLAHDFSEKIDCKKCYNCCTILRPSLTQEDILRISKANNMESDEFKDKFLEYDAQEDEFAIKTSPCPFLDENVCSVYECRPESCQSYPHLEKKEFVFRLIGVVENYSVCPIVFNTFEELKVRFGFQK